jgi:AcrR family transcriptional regulator
MTRNRKTQLTPQDWIKAAFRTLARGGVGSIKAETLAKTLKATKGSFYWHFKDVPSFRREMLALWEADATAAIITHVDAAASPGLERLALLVNIISTMNAENDYGGLSAEPAIRDWARSDREVAKALNRVDANRVAYVARLFEEAGYVSNMAKIKADLFYSGFVGLQTLAASRASEIKPQMSELLRLMTNRRTDDGA